MCAANCCGERDITELQGAKTMCSSDTDIRMCGRDTQQDAVHCVRGVGMHLVLESRDMFTVIMVAHDAVELCDRTETRICHVPVQRIDVDDRIGDD